MSFGLARFEELMPEVQFHNLEAVAQERRGEPVTCGIPWPPGLLRDPASVHLQNADGMSVPLQTRALDRWPDGSVRWLLLDWQASVKRETCYRLGVSGLEESPITPVQALNIVRKKEQVGPEHRSQKDVVIIETGVARFQLRTQESFSLSAALEDEPEKVTRACLEIQHAQASPTATTTERIEIEEIGPLRAVIRVDGSFWAREVGRSLFSARLHFFAGSATVRFAITLCNPRKADHPGGLWDLGNGGSIFIRDASLVITPPPGPERAVARFSHEVGSPWQSSGLPLEIYQDSSGGEHWRSSNHVNGRHVVPNTFRGYRLRTGEGEQHGARATPVVSLTRGDSVVSATMPYFWQNFPKALEASDTGLILKLFPSQYADVHELQGGEQKTHEFTIAFGPDRVTAEPLEWARAPLQFAAPPEWYCASGAVPYITPKATDANPEYLRLIDAAIEGADTFERKREVIDEYGWRHFGDIYADHEAVFHKGPAPLVSHYNNQYDAIAGLAFQFLRSGDVRWFRHMDELATHVIDIDIYHTDHDKAAYNHGLFWHTCHYVDADTGTHRSYPRAGKVCGGGPANEHNYTTGLVLHYFLTGSAASREAALALARWVVDMDDGNKTVFRWLARGYTGLASSSRTPSYHGPGRGAANSVAALLDGHRLSGDPNLLAKAEQLIRRCIHPADNIPARNLLDAENRWFYVMFLQSLGRYLDYKADRGELDFMYAYARASLLHYARWMTEHEYPYLDKPELLDYPTETWAAQDMRKSEVFKHAAKHAAGDLRARFLERSDFFFRYSTATLAGMRTRTLARPLVLLLSFGFMHSWFQQNPSVSAPPPAQEHHDFGRPMAFLPQKAKALRRLRVLLGASALAVVAGLTYLLVVLTR